MESDKYLNLNKFKSANLLFGLLNLVLCAEGFDGQKYLTAARASLMTYQKLSMH
jgi:hypothetical protein